jgi:hypothetical protein
MMDSAITPTAVSMSIYDQLNEDPEFSNVIENIDFVDLTDLIDRDSPLTFLAPPNNAWRKIIFGTLEGGDIIQRHLFRGLMFLDVLQLNYTGVDAKTLSSVNLDTTVVEMRGEFNEHLWVGGGHIYGGDILARNGVIHYIDRVINEPFKDDTVPPTASPQPTITPEPTMVVPPSPAPIVHPTGSTPINLPPIRTPSMAQAVDDSDQEEGSSASSLSAIATVLASVTLAAAWGMIAH